MSGFCSGIGKRLSFEGVFLVWGSLASWERRDIRQLDLCYDFGKFGESFRQSSRLLFFKKEEVEDEIVKSSYCYK